MVSWLTEHYSCYIGKALMYQPLVARRNLDGKSAPPLTCKTGTDVRCQKIIDIRMMEAKAVT